MKYEVIGRSAAVPAGCVLKLSDDQVRRRRGRLEEAKGAGWRVLDDGVVFKHGETFELVSGHIDEKRGDLRAFGRPSPAAAKAKRRRTAKKAASGSGGAEAASGSDGQQSAEPGLSLGGGAGSG